MTQIPDSAAQQGADLVRDDTSQSIIGVLKQIDAAAGEDGLNVAAIVDQLDERAFGILVLLLTLPCLVPGL
ncbi:MAG TPA: exopolysaccharide biosynthesis protein, partial [Terricaulis sp.]|nr:exopolysaccharide biosynthesis protein [Terricaulis sp.]